MLNPLMDADIVLNNVFDYSFPICTPAEPLGTGLFKDCDWKEQTIKYVDYEGEFRTYFKGAQGILLGETGLSLWELFHQYCYYFALYFCEKNPNWNFCQIKSDDGKLVHAFAFYYASDEILFADVRGITNSPANFFAEFFFDSSSRAYFDDPEDFIYDEQLYEGIKIAYSMIYDYDADDVNAVYSKLF